MVTNCQVCGNPMFGHRDMGFNIDGSINKDYCSGCYRFGQFTSGNENPPEEEHGLLNNATVPFLVLGSNISANTPGFFGPLH